MIEKKSSSWVFKASRMRNHSRSHVALKIVSEGRLVVDLLKKTHVSPEILGKISSISELAIKAKNASFLEKYRPKSAAKKA